MACFSRAVLAWTVALGLALVLVTLLVVTGHHAEITSPFTQAVEPELPLDRPPVLDMYHPPGLAVWPTP